MTVSISKMSIDYYLNSAAVGDGAEAGAGRDMTSYYTETAAPPGRWIGRGLSGLDLAAGQTVSREAAKSLYEDMADPTTGRTLGRVMTSAKREAPERAKTPTGAAAKSTREQVAGFDLTFSAPKSVSVAWAVAGPELQKRIQDAHHKAMEQTLEWAEQNVLQTRAGHGGVAHVPIEGMIASVFDHWDSRAGDPQLHSHCVVSNRAQRSSDGQWVSIDSYTLHRHVVALSEQYNNLLYDALHQDIGALPETRAVGDDPAVEAVKDALRKKPDGTPDDQEADPPQRVELAGIPDELITEFSERSLAIEERTDELITEHRQKTGRAPSAAQVLKLRQRATLETRTPKDDSDTTLDQKMIGWRRRTELSGYDPDRLITEATGHPDQSITPDMLTDEVYDKLGRWALDDTAQRRATFTRANLIASSERVLRLVRCRDLQQRHRLTETLVARAESQAVSLTATRSVAPETHDPTVAHRGRSVFDHRHTAGVFTTRQRLDDEEYLLSRRAATDAPRLDPEPLAERVAHVETKDGHNLSSDQAEASRQALSSTAGIEAIIGPAGSGKTTTMAAVSQLWSEDYGESSVIGLAPSAVSAEVLSQDLGATAENTAKWIYESVGRGAAERADRIKFYETKIEQIAVSNDAPALATARAEGLRAKLAQEYAAQARYVMRPGQLVIMDEASMVSTEQMAEIAQQADTAGAKLLLVGDPAQLDAVDAGGFLGLIDRTQNPSYLDQLWRFKNPWEQSASLRLRSGDPEVLETYDEAGRLHGTPDEDPSESAYQAWMADRNAGYKSILIASDNQTVIDLDRRAQADLVAAGDVDITQTVTLKDDSFAGIGDTILARRNDRRAVDSTDTFIANGSRLTITGIHDDGSATATNHATGGTITIHPDYLAKSVELGYATTAHRSQGVTVDTAHCIATSGLSRELFYVSMTRGKYANHAYVDLREDDAADSPDPWKMMYQTAGPQTPSEALQTVLKRSTAERTAHEIQDAEYGWAHDLGRMMHEHDYLAFAARTARTQAWAITHYGEQGLETLQQDPEWPRLVSADPANTHPAPPPQTSAELATGDDADPSEVADEPAGDQPEGFSVESIVTDCAPVQPARTGPADILESIDTTGTDQSRALTQLQSDITDELDQRRQQIESDPPNWWTELAAHSTQDRQRETLEAVLMWRAVSDQTDADTPLGTEPSGNDHLAPYYRTAAKSITDARVPVSDDPWDTHPSATGAVAQSTAEVAEQQAHFDAIIEDHSTDLTPPDLLGDLHPQIADKAPTDTAASDPKRLDHHAADWDTAPTVTPETETPLPGPKWDDAELAALAAENQPDAGAATPDRS